MDAARSLSLNEDPPSPPAAPEPVQRPTPVMEQFIEIKAANPDCLLFYRMGDFYELFFEDAEVASRALGIVLTKRGKQLGQDIPMCAVRGETPDGRTVLRLVTAGTLTEDTLLDARRNNYLLAVVRARASQDSAAARFAL